MTHVRTIKLNRPVSGKEIEEAAKKVSGIHFRREVTRIVDDVEEVLIEHTDVGGLTVHIVIATGENYSVQPIRLDAEYHSIAVLPGNMGVFGLGYGHQPDRLAEFRDQLQAELNGTAQTQPCLDCEGRGWYNRRQWGGPAIQITCENCRGTGELYVM